jgi:general stress protein 26
MAAHAIEGVAMFEDSHVAELKAKIKNVHFAMFTTVDQRGHLTSHPMTNQQIDEAGSFWFYTSTATRLWENIAHQPEVNLSFAEPGDSLYVSVSGWAERVVDREQIRALWSPMAAAWFPHGADDPHVVLVRVRPHAAEYWDAGSSKMVQMFEMAKAVLTGSTPQVDPGEHGKIKM